MSVTYRLELLVTDEGKPFYPPVGTLEKLSDDNAGYDLKVAEDYIPLSKASLLRLGVKGRMLKYTTSDGVTVEEDSHYTLEPRSSIYKTGYIMANSRELLIRPIAVN